MKLFLSSQAISREQAPAFIELIGKTKAQDIRLALIENAAFGEPGEKPWLHENRAAIQSHGFAVELVDLEDYRSKIQDFRAKLEAKDAVWFGGGNTFYLRWLLRESGADVIVKELVENGSLVYGGASAGAVVAGPTLKFFDTADDPKTAPELILEGLALIETVIVPHWADPQYGSILTDIETNLKAAGYKVETLTDTQAFVVDGSLQAVI